MFKIFTINSDGKIVFTKDELEKVLNKVWWDGYNSASPYWWLSPTVTQHYTDKISPTVTPYFTDKILPTVTPYYTDKTVEITCGSGK